MKLKLWRQGLKYRYRAYVTKEVWRRSSLEDRSSKN